MLLRQFSDQQTTGSDVINNLQCHFTLALSASSGYPHSALRSLGVAGALSDQLTHSLLVHDHQMVRTDTSGIATTGCDQFILDVQSQQRGHVATRGPLSLVLTVGDCHLRCSIGRARLLPQPAVSVLYASSLNVFDGHVHHHGSEEISFFPMSLTLNGQSPSEEHPKRTVKKCPSVTPSTIEHFLLPGKVSKNLMAASAGVLSVTRNPPEAYA